MAASDTVQNIPQRVKTSINGQQDENEKKNGADNGDKHNGSSNDNPDAAGGFPTSQPGSPPAKNSAQFHTTNTEKIRHIVQQSASDESKKKINALLGEIRQLPDLEKLLLYLQLPTGGTATDPFRQTSNNPLGNRFEVTQTVTWIRTHLEEDSEVSLPKHEVYEDYCHYCQMHAIKPLSTADFGKVMKHVFPSVRPRRLGTRGNSKYCYSGLRKKITLEVPKLPDLLADRDSDQDEDDVLSQEAIKACSYVILEWAHKLLENKFETLKELACHLVESKLVDGRSFGAFTVLSLAPNAGKSNPASLLLAQSGGNKHRDTTLQLQRKIQEKELLREQKKRLNVIRGEKMDSKERRRASSGPCARSMRSSSSKGSAQVSSMPSTPLPTTDSPPLNSNTKSTNRTEKNGVGVVVATKKETNGKNMQNGQPELQRKAGKVQIPRITSNRQSPKVCIASSVPASIILLPGLTPIGDLTKSTGKAKPKYKPIQPKPIANVKLLENCNQNGGENGENKQDGVENSNQIKKRLLTSSTNETSSNVSPAKRTRSDEEENVTNDNLDNLCDDSLFLEKTAEALFSEDEFTRESRDVLLSQSSCDPPKMSEKELTEMLGDENQEQGKNVENANTLMDFMEGSSASMEQDEELSHYFSETVTAPTTPTKRCGDGGQLAQITQLRWLLEHNLKPSPPAVAPSCTWQQNSSSHTLRQLLTQPVNGYKNDTSLNEPKIDSLESQPLPSMEMLTGFSLSQHTAEISPMNQSHDSTVSNSSMTVKRRVSFPINLNEAANLDSPSIASSVPPSPNTRCRSFNFTPISPRHTPLPSDIKGCLMSQPASATASPFMSPSSTPVPLSRSRHNSGQAVSSYGTTPRTTPYPSEQSSAVNSPFISPHPTPVPFCKSRSNTNQNINTQQQQQQQRMSTFSSGVQISPNTHALNVLNAQCRSRPSSGAMTLMSPRSAPLSPMNYMHDPELNNHFSMPTVGDTPQLRSRNNSNSSIPPMSPCSAPMSPQTSHNGLLVTLSSLNQSATSSDVDWTQNATQGYSNVGGLWYQNTMASNDPRILARQRQVQHLPSTSNSDSMTQQQQQSAAAMRMLLQRSNSVPVSHMPQQQRQVQQTNFDSPANYSYPATPTAAHFTDLMDPSPGFEKGAEQFCSRKNLSEMLSSPQSYDLGTTLEDLRACDDGYSQFAQEFEHQSPS